MCAIYARFARLLNSTLVCWKSFTNFNVVSKSMLEYAVKVWSGLQMVKREMFALFVDDLALEQRQALHVGSGCCLLVLVGIACRSTVLKFRRVG
jgi:hypothetical protein